MEKKYTCKLYLKVQPGKLKALLAKVLHLLDFTPYKVGIYFDEFKKPLENLPYEYNRDYILQNLAMEECGGITNVSFYDKEWADENYTPFFRFSINDSSISSHIPCNFEWVAYNNLDWLVQDHKLLKEVLGAGVEFVYCLLYNQSDAYHQTQLSKKNGSNNSFGWDSHWGKLLRVYDMIFIAAPLMYLGKGFEKVVKLDRILALDYSREITVNERRLVKVHLFDLYEDPSEAEHRKRQKYFWKSLSLNKIAKKYDKSTTTADPIAYIQRRAEISKARKIKRP